MSGYDSNGIDFTRKGATPIKAMKMGLAELQRHVAKFSRMIQIVKRDTCRSSLSDSADEQTGALGRNM
jgi:hypothetical protein